MALITSDDFPAVRAAINVTLDEVGLPDAVIALPIYLGAADTDVKARDPLWATRTAGDLRHLKNATIYFTAARLVLSLPRINSETFGQRYQFRVDQLSPTEQAASLQAFGDMEIEAVINPGSDELVEKPVMFTLANARRHCRYRTLIPDI